MKIVSACLLGLDTRHNRVRIPSKKILKLAKHEILIPVCPEQLGGLSTPRERCRIVGGDGKDVLRGNSRVISESGKNLTKEFIRGAKEVLKIAKLYNIKEAIFKSYSPSCGCGTIYGEDFTKKIKGDGVVTVLLKKNRIAVKTEKEI